MSLSELPRGLGHPHSKGLRPPAKPRMPQLPDTHSFLVALVWPCTGAAQGGRCVLPTLSFLGPTLLSAKKVFLEARKSGIVERESLIRNKNGQENRASLMDAPRRSYSCHGAGRTSLRGVHVQPPAKRPGRCSTGAGNSTSPPHNLTGCSGCEANGNQHLKVHLVVESNLFSLLKRTRHNTLFCPLLKLAVYDSGM
jgi:hypothetical protein